LPAPFRAGATWPLPPLRFHLEAQAFSFYQPALKNDPLWINVRDFFNPDEPGIGKALSCIYATPGGPARLGDYTRRLHQLRGILDRRLAVEYVPSDASIEEAAEIYLVANRGGSRE